MLCAFLVPVFVHTLDPSLEGRNKYTFRTKARGYSGTSPVSSSAELRSEVTSRRRGHILLERPGSDQSMRVRAVPDCHGEPDATATASSAGPKKPRDTTGAPRRNQNQEGGLRPRATNARGLPSSTIQEYLSPKPGPSRMEDKKKKKAPRSRAARSTRAAASLLLREKCF